MQKKLQRGLQHEIDKKDFIKEKPGVFPGI